MDGKLYAVTLLLTLIAAVLGFAERANDRSRRFTRASTLLAFAAAAATFVTRWIAAGHLPLFGTFESAISLAVVLLAWAVFSDGVRAGFIAAVAAAVLSQGFFYDRATYALTISERSIVVDAHAVLAWVAFALLTANAAAGIFVIWRNRGTDASLASRSVERTLSLGFLFYSAMIATGALYKFMLFGVVWSFDPIETLAFATWLSYGVLLHLLLVTKWSAGRIAPWCVGVFVLLIVSYRAIILFPPTATYHIFDIDKRIHVTEGASR